MIDDRYALDGYPWEKDPEETANNYAAFILYRDLGHRRTLRAAAIAHYDIAPPDYDPMGGKIRTIEKWSARFRWVARAEEYDGFMQRLTDADDQHTVREMRKRHALIATAAQSKIVSALNNIDASKLNLEQLMRVFDLAVKNERLARGVADSITATSTKGLDSIERTPITDDALERKLSAWLASADGDNDIEKGEPKVSTPDVEIPGAATPWPSSPDKP